MKVAAATTVLRGSPGLSPEKILAKEWVWAGNRWQHSPEPLLGAGPGEFFGGHRKVPRLPTPGGRLHGQVALTH